MEVEDFKFKRVCKENLKDLVYLFKEVRNVNVPIEYFEKKFDTSFAGCSYVGYFAYDSNGIPAAFCSVFPCLINIKGKPTLSAQMGDVITHLDHQRKGLFTLLGNYTFKLAKEEKIKIIYGFPNRNSYKGLVNNLKFIHKENFENYYIPVCALPIYKICAKLGIMNLYKFYLKFILSFIKKTDVLNNSVSKSNFDYVIRDNDFYYYKKYENNFLLNFNDFKIWFKVDDGLFVGDIELYNVEFERCFKKLKILSFLLGLHSIKFEVSPLLFWSQVLKKKYQPTEGWAICFYCLDNSLNIDNIKFTAGDTDTF